MKKARGPPLGEGGTNTRRSSRALGGFLMSRRRRSGLRGLIGMVGLPCVPSRQRREHHEREGAIACIMLNELTGWSVKRDGNKVVCPACRVGFANIMRGWGRMSRADSADFSEYESYSAEATIFVPGSSTRRDSPWGSSTAVIGTWLSLRTA